MSAEKTEDISVIVVPPKVIAKTFSISERRVRQLAQEGVLVKSGNGRYNFAESVKNYIVYLKAASNIQNENTSDFDLDEEKAKHERLKIQKTELQLKIMTGELHHSEDVESVMTHMLSSFKAKILSLPTKLASPLSTMKKPLEIQSYLKEECQRVLDELSSYDPSLFFKSIESDEGYDEEIEGDTFDEEEDFQEND